MYRVFSWTLTLAVPDCLGTSGVATARSALASQSLGFGVCCAVVQYQTCWAVLVACLYASHGCLQRHASPGLDHCVLDEAASQGVEASGCFLEHCRPFNKKCGSWTSLKSRTIEKFRAVRGGRAKTCVPILAYTSAVAKSLIIANLAVGETYQIHDEQHKCAACRLQEVLDPRHSEKGAVHAYI